MRVDPLALCRLQSLMQLSEGKPDIKGGVLDGPVDVDHPALSQARLQRLGSGVESHCRDDGVACAHGTAIAGILAASRGSSAPAICPNCTLLWRHVFADAQGEPNQVPETNLAELAQGIIDCIAAGARVINISAAPAHPGSPGNQELSNALDYACQHGVLVVAAAGNQGLICSSPITRHRWAIAVTACDSSGRPSAYSNLGASIARHGALAPGTGIATLAPAGGFTEISGSSAAAPFVTGTAALLWSLFPQLTAAALRQALTPQSVVAGRTVVPARLDAHASLQLVRQHASVQRSQSPRGRQ